MKDRLHLFLISAGPELHSIVIVAAVVAHLTTTVLVRFKALALAQTGADQEQPGDWRNRVNQDFPHEAPSSSRVASWTTSVLGSSTPYGCSAR